MKIFLLIGVSLIAVACFGQPTTIATPVPVQETILLAKNNYQNLFQQHFNFGLMSLSSTNPCMTVTPLSLHNPFMHGMFCTMESKLETKTKLAPRFRLGSLNYTEWMEGKAEIYTRYRK